MIGPDDERFCNGGLVELLAVRMVLGIPGDLVLDDVLQRGIARCRRQERTFEAPYESVRENASTVRTQDGDEDFQKPQANVKVLELRPRETPHQNASPPCATFLGRTL